MPKRILQGVVVSDKNDKTIVVKVERRLRQAAFGRECRRIGQHRPAPMSQAPRLPGRTGTENFESS